jgi:hypothetical protein
MLFYLKISIYCNHETIVNLKIDKKAEIVEKFIENWSQWNITDNKVIKAEITIMNGIHFHFYFAEKVFIIVLILI